MTIVLTPQPVLCKNCFTVLKASYAAENYGLCPGCQEPACYTCGCSEERACARESQTLDGKRSVTHVCSWADVGICSFCREEACYVLYMEATGREPVDPYILRTYRAGETHHVTATGI